MPETFHGMEVRSLKSAHLRLDYLTEAGPRIIGLYRGNSRENLLADAFDMTVSTPFGKYYFLGGHRLWIAPEVFPRTYHPDMAAVKVQALMDGASITAPAEAETSIAKSIEIHLHPDRPAVTIHHDLRNDGARAVELAPWAITQMKLGGVAILPQQVGPLDKTQREQLPNRHLAFWQYTSIRDARLRLFDEVLLLHGKAQRQAFKVGCPNTRGWMAYWRAGVLFVKRSEMRMGSAYPDAGCSAELFCQDRFLELETLGPLSVLHPGRSVRHTETWELYDRWDPPFIPEYLRQILKPELDKVS